MAKPKGVNKYRSGVKNPHQQVLVYRDQETQQVTVTYIDWQRGKVLQFKENGKQEDLPRMRKSYKK